MSSGEVSQSMVSDGDSQSRGKKGKKRPYSVEKIKIVAAVDKEKKCEGSDFFCR